MVIREEAGLSARAWTELRKTKNGSRLKTLAAILALGQDISLRFSGAFSEWRWKHQFSRYQRNPNSRSLRPPARWKSPPVSLSFSTFLWPARRFSIESVR